MNQTVIDHADGDWLIRRDDTLKLYAGEAFGEPSWVEEPDQAWGYVERSAATATGALLTEIVDARLTFIRRSTMAP